ncbi:GLPGLI family protein [Tenacibaculum xiamenense]|uniref:GLPGLI family protein n=1 Tax=Tenacibaculum xiamenense TaxID=1261553 RepID=UPI0038B578E6
MKNIYIYLFVFLTTSIWAQKDLQGKAIYQSKTTVDMSSWGGDMSEERKKQIKERMKNFLEKTYTLEFTSNESQYKENAKLEAPGTRGFRFGGFAGGGVKYKNLSDSTMLESTEFFGKRFLIEDAVKKPEWELGAETKQIGKYTCFKAIMTKKVDAFDWRNMRRRRGRKGRDKGNKKEKEGAEANKVTEEIEIPKTVEVIAWYTPQIPVSNGPGGYFGLPGLILEINEGRTTILCSEIVLNPKEKIVIDVPTKGDKVTREEYNSIMKKKMEEMREMFQRRRGQGGRGRGRGGRF